METQPERLERKDPFKPMWPRGIVLSAILHTLVFSSVLLIPNSIPTRQIRGATFYEVDLVEMPRRAAGPAETGKPAAPVREARKEPAPATPEKPRTIRPPTPPAPEQPVVIAKRTVEKPVVEKKDEAPKKPEVSPSKLIDDALSRIEKKVDAQKRAEHMDQALSRIQERVESGDDAGIDGGTAGFLEGGMVMRIYQLEVRERIRSNWSYPVSLLGPGRMKDLEAIVELRVKSDGTILKSSFKKRSSDTMFDTSVLKAIERSDPLPPFPESYRKTSENLVIRFDLSEMLDFS